MKKYLALVLATLFLSAAGTVLHAHHSFAAQYDGTKAVRLVGTLTRIDWTNPHSYFYLDVKDEATGEVEKWVCEGAGTNALSRRGLNKGDIKIGDSLVVDGYRSRNGKRMIDARRVTLSDGRSIYGGSPGDGGPGDTAVPAAGVKPNK